jgi:hypothetical protein
MEKKEAAKLMLNAVKLLGTFATIINPEIDHISCYAIRDDANVVGFAGDKQVFDMHYFGTDESIKIDDQYFDKGVL